MIDAIARLRKIADQTEGEARDAHHGRSVRAEMVDLAAKWHWLAAEAAKLCTKSRQLSGADGICAACVEQCTLRVAA